MNREFFFKSFILLAFFPLLSASAYQKNGSAKNFDCGTCHKTRVELREKDRLPKHDWMFTDSRYNYDKSIEMAWNILYGQDDKNSENRLRGLARAAYRIAQIDNKLVRINADKQTERERAKNDITERWQAIIDESETPQIDKAKMVSEISDVFKSISERYQPEIDQISQPKTDLLLKYPLLSVPILLDEGIERLIPTTVSNNTIKAITEFPESAFYQHLHRYLKYVYGYDPDDPENETSYASRKPNFNTPVDMFLLFLLEEAFKNLDNSLSINYDTIPAPLIPQGVP